MEVRTTESVCRHGQKYSALRPCEECADDPGEAPNVDDVVQADPRLLEIERICRDAAGDLLKRGKERLKQRKDDKDKDSIGESTMVKLFDCAAKYIRQEIELVEARAKRQYMRDLMQHEQIMAGLRKAN